MYFCLWAQVSLSVIQLWLGEDVLGTLAGGMEFCIILYHQTSWLYIAMALPSQFSLLLVYNQQVILMCKIPGNLNTKFNGGETTGFHFPRQQFLSPEKDLNSSRTSLVINFI